MAAIQEPSRPQVVMPAWADRGFVRVLVVSATVVLFTVVAWLAALIPAMPGGEVGEQLASLRESMALYRWGFVNAALINPAFVVMLYSASVLLVPQPLRPHEVVGGLLVATYWLLPTLAYISQFALLPRLLDTGAAETWYFGNPASVSYWLAMTGYGLLGIGAVLLAPRFITGSARSFGWVLLASGLASALGLIGYSVASDPLEFASTIGGALVLPLAILALVGISRLRHGVLLSAEGKTAKGAGDGQHAV